MVQRPPAYNGLVGGSSPSGPTPNFINAGNVLPKAEILGVGENSWPTQCATQRYEEHREHPSASGENAGSAVRQPFTVAL